jgi:hypothetical protein
MRPLLSNTDHIVRHSTGQNQEYLGASCEGWPEQTGRKKVQKSPRNGEFTLPETVRARKASAGSSLTASRFHASRLHFPFGRPEIGFVFPARFRHGWS